jgi:hypothetical protein
LQKNAMIPVEFSEEYEFSDAEETLSDYEDADGKRTTGFLQASGGAALMSSAVQLPEEARDAFTPDARSEFEAALALDRKDLIISKTLKQVAVSAQRSTAATKVKAARASSSGGQAGRASVEDSAGTGVQVLTTMGRGSLDGEPDALGIQKVWSDAQYASSTSICPLMIVLPLTGEAGQRGGGLFQSLVFLRRR